MPATELYAGALGLLLQHDLTGCRHAAGQAAGLLDRLAVLPGLDKDMRGLCERMADRLDARSTLPCA